MKLKSEAALRNLNPILEKAEAHFPMKGKALELASGAGYHIVNLAQKFPALEFFPNDIEREYIKSIESYISEDHLENVKQPTCWDINTPEEKGVPSQVDVVIAINLVQASPWPSTSEALFSIAEKKLAKSDPDQSIEPFVFFYSPLFRDDWSEEKQEGNRRLDHWLKTERDPQFGVRHQTEILEIASRHGFHAAIVYDMPANNTLIVFEKS